MATDPAHRRLLSPDEIREAGATDVLCLPALTDPEIERLAVILAPAVTLRHSA